MPNLIDIARRATDQPPVALLHEPRCLMARDAQGRCAACAEACPVDALEVRRLVAEGAQPYETMKSEGQAGPRIDDERCVRCGACVAACPTNALLAPSPLDDEGLLARVAAVGEAAARRVAVAGIAAAAAGVEEGAAEGAAGPEVEAEPATATAGFACERRAGALGLDAERTVVLPCLAWVDAALLVHLACSGAERVVVPADACASCELAAVADQVRAAVGEAQRVCDAWGLAVAFEADEAGLLAAPDSDTVGEVSRRALLSQAGASLLDTAKGEAAKQLDALAGSPAADAAPPEPDVRRWQALDDLHAAGLPAEGTTVPRVLAPRVSICFERCSGCAQCALFCPTEALRKAGRVVGGGTLLEFDPARCRDCGVCENTCRYGALTCEETFTATELFALDPIEIPLPKRRVLPERHRN